MFVLKDWRLRCEGKEHKEKPAQKNLAPDRN